MELRRQVTAYTLALCRAITSCRDLQHLLQLLQQAVSALSEAADAPDPDTSNAEAGEELGACLAALAAAAAAAAAEPGQRRDLLHQQFYASSAFQDLSNALLTGELRGQAHATWLTALWTAADASSKRPKLAPWPGNPCRPTKPLLVPVAVVAPDWLPRMDQQQRHDLFGAWFERAPAAALLPALTRCPAAPYNPA